MTLRQLRHIDMIAKCDTLAAVAGALFVTRPSLIAALRELEQRLGITLFLRSRKGLSLTPAGEGFLGYARRVLNQVPLVEQHYAGEAHGRHHFCVSSQHYSFAIEAFVALLNACDGSQYESHMWETEAYRILEDVAKVRSGINVLYRDQSSIAVLQRNSQEMKFSFTPVYRVKPHVSLGTQYPLTEKVEIPMEDLHDYPRLSYEQGQHNSFYFSKEIQSTVESDKGTVVCDHTTLSNLLIGMSGYTICSDIIGTELNGKNTVVCPLAVDNYMKLGYALPKKRPTSDLTLVYIDLLRQFMR